MADIPKHKDIVGRTIKVGDVVVVAQWKTVAIGVVLKINPKMITVNVLPNGDHQPTINSNTPWKVVTPPHGDRRLYPQTLLVVDSTDYITMFVLKNS
jgi:hypothetical protein